MRHTYRGPVLFEEFSKRTGPIVFSAVLLILAFPRFDVTWLAWIALVPMIHALVQITTLRRAWWYGYLHGWLVWAALIYWLNYVTVPGYLLLVSYLASYHALFALGVAWFLRQPSQLLQHSFARLLLIPSWWVILEWIRNYAFSGFSWSILAYAQAAHPLLIQTADLIGAFGVSWLMLWINVAIGQLLRPQSRHRKIQVAVATTIIYAFAIGYGWQRLHAPVIGDDIRIAVVQGNIPQDMKLDANAKEHILTQYEDLTKSIAPQHPDLIIWPETSVPAIVPLEQWVMRRLQSLAHTMRTPMLIGAPSSPEDFLDPTLWNSAILFDRKGEMIDRYDKLHLVPFGEFVPFVDALPWLQRLIVTGDFDPGDAYNVLHIPVSQQSTAHSKQKIQQIPIGVLICFEDVFPEMSRAWAQRGARLLVNITNDGWFKESSAPYQHFQASIFRAVEQRVPVVRSANTGASAFIEPTGRIRCLITNAQGSIFTADAVVETVTIPMPGPGTAYTRFGNWWVLLCAFLVIGGIIISVMNKSSKQ